MKQNVSEKTNNFLLLLKNTLKVYTRKFCGVKRVTFAIRNPDYAERIVIDVALPYTTQTLRLQS